MLQVGTAFYYLVVQKIDKDWEWHGDYLVTQKQFKNRNLNHYFSYKPIKIVVRCQTIKSYVHTLFIIILVQVSYFDYGIFNTLHYSNHVSLMSV